MDDKPDLLCLHGDKLRFTAVITNCRTNPSFYFGPCLHTYADIHSHNNSTRYTDADPTST